VGNRIQENVRNCNVIGACGCLLLNWVYNQGKGDEKKGIYIVTAFQA